MEKATDATGDNTVSKRKPRGPKLDVKRVSRQEVLRVDMPAGSRFKGLPELLCARPGFEAEFVHYRRECWVTADGKAVLASLPTEIVDSYGTNLRRFA